MCSREGGRDRRKGGKEQEGGRKDRQGWRGKGWICRRKGRKREAEKVEKKEERERGRNK